MDAHMVGQRETGNETYIVGLLSGLQQQRDLQVAAAVEPDAALPDELTNGSIELLPLPSRSNWSRLLWGLEAECRRWRADLLHVTYVAPLRCSCPVAVTVHDASFRRCPEHMSLRDRLLFATLVPATLRRAAAVITDSEHARKEISYFFPSLKAPTSAVPLGVSARFRPSGEESTAQLIRHRYETGDAYVLAVGNLQPRKNLSGLVRAFGRVRERFPKVRLVIAGQARWQTSQLLALVDSMGLTSHVVFCGYVPQDDLPGLYSCASAFVFPSTYEGFGLPILEAMACGTPVIALNASSVPEVAGEAALLTDPASEDALASAIVRVLEDRDLAGHLVRRGLEQVKRFSWMATAERTLEVYRTASGLRN